MNFEVDWVGDVLGGKSGSFLGRFAVGALLVLSGEWRCEAEAWLTYRGPFGNGISHESGWRLPTPGSLVWKMQIGIGTASVVAGGGRVWVSGNERGLDVLRCLDAANGREVWRFSREAPLDPNLFEGGPRSTPTVIGDRVYVLAHDGALSCLDAVTGALVWQKQLVRDFGGRKPEWGYSGSPLGYAGRLILDSGGEGASTIALDARTGAEVWRAGSDRAGYASPLVASFGGQATLLLFKAEGLIGCDPANGQERWRFPWKTPYNIHAATPLPFGENEVLISSGYNAGAAALRINGDQVRLLWSNKHLRAHINSPVFLNGAVFGIDGNTGGGNLVCLDPRTGERLWEEKSVKGGSIVAVGGRLVVLSEKGELIVAEASGGGFRSLSRQSLFSRRSWAQVTVSDGRLFARDNLGSLVCLDLR